MVAERRVAIIGSGIAGLCDGVYARKRGFKTEIFVTHSIPGGLATAWKRQIHIRKLHPLAARQKGTAI